MNSFTEHKREMRAGDSTWCTHCGKTWDTNDRDPPSCDPVVEVVPTRTGDLKRPRPFIKPVIDKMSKKIQYGGGDYSESDLRKHMESRTPEHIAMIGFLTAKLACYEPDSPTVKRGLEYLNAHT